MTNTVKHAGAQNILVRCFEEGSNTMISYQDDGKGMDTVKGFKSGMGMQNIEARLRMINASSEMPAVSNGFFIKIILPAKQT
jgi:signal transduction histidine kinase